MVEFGFHSSTCTTLIYKVLARRSEPAFNALNARSSKVFLTGAQQPQLKSRLTTAHAMQRLCACREIAFVELWALSEGEGQD